MKKLLLTSAIVATAGAAAAEVTWSGDAEFGYRSHYEHDFGTAYGDLNQNGVDTDLGEGKVSDTIASIAAAANAGDAAAQKTVADFTRQGKLGTEKIFLENQEAVSPLYYEAGLTPTAKADLGGGASATLSYNFALTDPGRIQTDVIDAVVPGTTALKLDHGFPTLVIEAPQGKFSVGDVDHAAKRVSNTFESAVEMTGGEDDLVAAVDVNYSGVDAGMSYVAADDKPNGAGLNQEGYSLGAKGEFSGATFAIGYESDPNDNDDLDDDTKYGINAGYSWNGINAKLAWLQSQTHTQTTTTNGNTVTVTKEDYATQSIGFGADYTLSNGVKLGAEYTMNSTDKNSGFGVDKDGKMYDQYNAYKVWAGFEALGADITAGYKNKNDVLSQYEDNNYNHYMAGLFVDAEYEIEGYGVTVMAGYDQTDNIVTFAKPEDWVKADTDELFGAYYIGAKYDINENATLKGSYSNGNEIDPDESIKPGATLAVSLSF